MTDGRRLALAVGVAGSLLGVTMLAVPGLARAVDLPRIVLALFLAAVGLLVLLTAFRTVVTDPHRGSGGSVVLAPHAGTTPRVRASRDRVRTSSRRDSLDGQTRDDPGTCGRP